MADPDTPSVFVSGETARAVFQWPDAIKALQHAYAQQADPVALPPRTVARGGGAWLRTLPALPPGSRYFGAKLMGMSATAPAPGAEYVIVLFDRETSRIAAFVDANMVTAYRTAATTAAALDRIAPAKVDRLAVLGSGLEAAMHVRAIASVRDLSEIAIFSPTPAKREAFAASIQEELGVTATACASPEEAVRESGLVLAAARSQGERPILYGDWLRDGAVVASIGSTVPEQREIDISVIKRADLIVCDMVEEVLEETGDMIAAHEAGIEFHDKSFGLFDLMSGSLDSRVQAARNPMFKSVGGGLQDVVVAGLILTKALEAGLALPLPAAFETKR
ncbi:hypothetical protein L288_14610 [Sphingobium quisquiliarum P25]|uniref:Ornithine cyclodeaminase n=1 Tax=Sphingobium quisquiliarum P25 TaxID=1329909 RepID=T0GV82_9SPHN|nr:ornithine cyclodeaminase family protein [Sphingobium quisquiliarum]EQB03828.1 hypothetical protein L288_14610 [Sphingobium quisquiliarum P25]